MNFKEGPKKEMSAENRHKIMGWIFATIAGVIGFLLCNFSNPYYSLESTIKLCSFLASLIVSAIFLISATIKFPFCPSKYEYDRIVLKYDTVITPKWQSLIENEGIYFKINPFIFKIIIGMAEYTFLSLFWTTDGYLYQIAGIIYLLAF
jgi:uncharacterized membrane protein YeaQ/YmgE (transglycosylase-associated protein family)